MESMPYPGDGLLADSIVPLTGGCGEPVKIPSPVAIVPSDWKAGLPSLSSGAVRLRELRPSDAESLHMRLTKAEVSRFINPPPASVDGFERFIRWTMQQRSAGTLVCFAITVEGSETAIGLFQVRTLE